MNKSVVVKSPKDQILDAVIIEVNKTCWAEIIAPDKLAKFDEPNKPLVQIRFEATYEDKKLKGEDTFAYYQEPMSNSKLGMFLDKYEDLQTGQKIKVIYDKDGFGKVKVD